MGYSSVITYLILKERPEGVLNLTLKLLSAARSELTGQEYKLKVVARCLRSIEKAGGFDSYMLNTKVFKMSDNARSIRKEIKKIKDKVAA